jgi:hypothetical protein
MGVDVIDSDYPKTTADLCYALTFQYDPTSERPAVTVDAAVSRRGATAPAAHCVAGTAAATVAECGEVPWPGGDATKMSVRDKRLAVDARPLLPGCQCFACRNHSRGFVHHLFNVHEMLGPTLLQCHNSHHYQQFFAHVRAAVQRGALDEYRRWFVRVNGLC